MKLQSPLVDRVDMTRNYQTQQVNGIDLDSRNLSVSILSFGARKNSVYVDCFVLRFTEFHFSVGYVGREVEHLSYTVYKYGCHTLILFFWQTCCSENSGGFFEPTWHLKKLVHLGRSHWYFDVGFRPWESCLVSWKTGTGVFLLREERVFAPYPGGKTMCLVVLKPRSQRITWCNDEPHFGCRNL